MQQQRARRGEKSKGKRSAGQKRVRSDIQGRKVRHGAEPRLSGSTHSGGSTANVLRDWNRSNHRARRAGIFFILFLFSRAGLKNKKSETYLTNEHRSHVLVPVLELDVLGDRDAVLGNLGRTKRLVNDDIASLGSKSRLNSVGKPVDALKHQRTSLVAKLDIFAAERASAHRARDAANDVLRSMHGMKGSYTLLMVSPFFLLVSVAKKSVRCRARCKPERSLRPVESDAHTPGIKPLGRASEKKGRIP